MFSTFKLGQLRREQIGREMRSFTATGAARWCCLCQCRIKIIVLKQAENNA